jgi:hypothetical protein
MKTQLQLQQQLQLQEEDEVTIVTGNIGDQSLKPQEEDYIAFPDSDVDSDTSTLDSGESELYDSDKDYSWFGRYRGKWGFFNYALYCILQLI